MNLFKALATVSSMTLVSRILGFVRDIVIARAFGAGLSTDAFFVAFRLPNLLRRLFAEGAFSQAFVPILAEYKNRRGHERRATLVDHVATLLALVLFVVSADRHGRRAGADLYQRAGFRCDPDKFDADGASAAHTFPYILFISLVSFAGGILNT